MSLPDPAPIGETHDPIIRCVVPEGRRAGRWEGRTDRTQEGQIPPSCRLSAPGRRTAGPIAQPALDGIEEGIQLGRSRENVVETRMRSSSSQ